MATVGVKMTDRLKEDAKETAETMGYTGLSEFVRDAVRDKIEEQLELRREVAERVERIREDSEDVETFSTEEAKKKLDLE
jgi:metal-responsive CopG/Arc/MetJ family transcriptional regulator